MYAFWRFCKEKKNPDGRSRKTETGALGMPMLQQWTMAHISFAFITMIFVVVVVVGIISTDFEAHMSKTLFQLIFKQNSDEGQIPYQSYRIGSRSSRFLDDTRIPEKTSANNVSNQKRFQALRWQKRMMAKNI